MSRFDEAMVSMNTSVMTVYGDLLTVRRGDFSFDLEGAFSSALDSSAALLPFGEARAVVLFRSDEFAATEAGHGDYVIRGEQTYRITDVVDDDGGIATVTLGLPT